MRDDEITREELIETLAFVADFLVLRDKAGAARHCSKIAHWSKLTAEMLKIHRLAMAGKIGVIHGGT